jgi:hypothetical protein
MTDLLHEADHAGIARAVMLRAIKARAGTKDDASASDISEALEGFEDICATGAWFELVRRAFWLASRASGRTTQQHGWSSLPASLELDATEGGGQ